MTTAYRQHLASSLALTLQIVTPFVGTLELDRRSPPDASSRHATGSAAWTVGSARPDAIGARG